MAPLAAGGGKDRRGLVGLLLDRELLEIGLAGTAPEEADVMFKVFSIPNENSLISNQPLNMLSVLSPTIGSDEPAAGVNFTNASNAMIELLESQ